MFTAVSEKNSSVAHVRRSIKKQATEILPTVNTEGYQIAFMT